MDLGSTNITTLAGTHFNATSLSDAAFCDGNIGNSYGVLVCDEPSDMPGLSSPGPEVPCEALYSDNYYESKLDASGGNAPDGVSHLHSTPCTCNAVLTCNAAFTCKAAVTSALADRCMA